jgi:3-hydroxyacyl-CoA dehydrogenase
MNLNERLQNVAIIGAAGKMVSGIALLLAQEMALQKLQPENREKSYELILIDIGSEALQGLLAYLKTQAVKLAEKNIVNLRNLYQDRKDLVENQDFIDAFVDDLQINLQTSTDLGAAKNSHLIFEAIVENADVKISILNKLNDICSAETFYFTNTSSIPIQRLDEKVGLNGRIIGYHFYNPPAVQKLVELISPKGLKSELQDIGQELGQRLRKKLIPSNDIAGFIGNGHFMRDGLHAIAEVEKLKQKYSHPEAIYIMNHISQDFLIRPMGIFQLIDYVGIDVFQLILRTMDPYFPQEELHSDLIDEMVEKKVLGGQNPDGTQKDGFLKYEKSRPVAVYNLDKSDYLAFDAGDWKAKIDQQLGAPPAGFAPWRQLLVDPNREKKLSTYFNNMKSASSVGVDLALAYAKKSKEIGKHLVSQGVANSTEDVNGVLLNGFYHLYGPVNDYI